jgi:hypothetical protein
MPLASTVNLPACAPSNVPFVIHSANVAVTVECALSQSISCVAQSTCTRTLLGIDGGNAL